MIAITNDQGLSLDLLPDTKLVTEQAVAWLSDEELPGEFSYPIDVPLTNNNKRFVAHGYRPDLAQPRTELAVTVRMDGVLYRRCIFSFRVNSGKLSGYLKIDASEFYDKIRKLTLLEALPDVVSLGDGLISTPPVDIQTRLKQIAALKPGQFPCTFFPIRNQTFLEDSFDESKLAGYVRNDYVNAWERLADGSYGFPVDLPNAPKFGRHLCPQFYLSYVLERIMTLAGYQIESEWLAQEEIQRIVIKNLTSMSQYVANLGDFITGHQLIPGMFLPDMSVGDFLKAVKGRFGLVFVYNSNTKICRITQFVKTITEGPSIDLTSYQSGDYSTQDRDTKGYTVSDYVDSADELYKDSTGKPITPPAQTIGNGLTPVSLKAGTCQLVYTPSNLSTDAQWIVPTVRQAGNVLDIKYKQSDRYLTQEGIRPNSVGLVFLTYRGMTTDSKNNSYPLATPDVRDGRQLAIGTQALTLGGRNGAWQNYLRAYYYFRDQTQLITQPLVMPVSILANLRLDRTVSLSLEDQIRRSYLISKIQAQAPGADGRANVRLECLTLPSGIELATNTEEPIVWVEFSLGPITTLGQPIRVFAVLKVTIWADQAKTQPAVVTNLPINLRFQKSHLVYNEAGKVVDYLEYVQTYLVNGSNTVIDPAFKINYADLDSNSSYYYDIDVGLAPGDGYKIVGPKVVVL